MNKRILEKTQKQIVALAAGKYPQVYLVGGTAESSIKGTLAHEEAKLVLGH